MRYSLALLLALLLGPWGLAEWHRPECSVRRLLILDAAADRISGGETCRAEILTAGLSHPDGSDLVVTTPDGRVVPSTALRAGPGDTLSIAFPSMAGQVRYWAYFGQPKAKPQPAAPDLPAGIVVEMRRLPQGADPRTAKAMEADFDRAGVRLGRAVVDRLFVGGNPIGESAGTISRFSGQLRLDQDAKITFALSARDRGGLFVDGKPQVFAPWAANDARFTATVDLTRGRHSVVVYQASLTADAVVSLAWRKSTQDRFEVIPASAFGRVFPARVDILETPAGPRLADFAVAYLGEVMLADGGRSHRYRFSVSPELARNKCEWSFGDGQKADGNSVEHVFLEESLAAVFLSATATGAADRLTHRVQVEREHYRAGNPQRDDMQVHAALVTKYDASAMTPRSLGQAIRLFCDVGDTTPLAKFAGEFARRPLPDRPAFSFQLLGRADELLSRKSPQDSLRLWQSVPMDSPMQPDAGVEAARALLWGLGDAARAEELLSQLRKTHPKSDLVKRTHAIALVLRGKAKEGQELLAAIEVTVPVAKRPAVRGAMARTLEYYLTEGDLPSAETAWEGWCREFPLDFMEGHSVLLRAKLMEKRAHLAAAATVAESFARAVPQSSYASQLLYFAAESVKTTDPTRSAALRTYLKQKYPEDPLSQAP